MYHTKCDAVVILIAETNYTFGTVSKSQQLFWCTVQCYFVYISNFGKHEHTLCTRMIGGHGGHNIFKRKIIF